MNASVTLDSPLGKLAVTIKDHGLYTMKIGAEHRTENCGDTGLIEQLRTELNAYFTDTRFRFSFPLDLQGTPFQKRVWQALCRIPAGQTLTYGQLASRLGSSPRAVGNACRANPVPILVPCHRVIGKHGIGGYDGQTSGRRLDIKRWLLRHEGVNIG